MSYITYKQNDIVYIDEIGYGSLTDCGKFKALSVKNLQSVSSKRQSIHFDPDLFNSDGDSSKKSDKQSNKPEKIQTQNKCEEQNQQAQQKNDKKQDDKTIEKPINIVTLKLYGTNVLIYTCDKNIRKHINIPVKALLGKRQSTFNLSIDINRNIQSLKKLIFEQLGLKIAYYYNIKLFVTSPCLTDLNVPSKTIYQCLISQNSKLVITGKHAFCFQNIHQNIQDKYILGNNNMSLIGQQKVKVISLPPIPESSKFEGKTLVQTANKNAQPAKIIEVNKQNIENDDQKKSDQKQKQKEKEQRALVCENKSQQTQQIAEETKKNSQNSQQTEVQKQGKQKAIGQEQRQMKKSVQLQPKKDFCFVYGDESYEYGRHFWEIKIDKIPKKIKQLQVGIKTEDKIYTISPLTGQKHQYIINKNCDLSSYIKSSQIVLDTQTKHYSSDFKQGESVGVLLQISKLGTADIIFYKNNISLGKCFTGIKGEIKPIFSIGQNGQISLDTRSQCPLDSYRKK